MLQALHEIYKENDVAFLSLMIVFLFIILDEVTGQYLGISTPIPDHIDRIPFTDLFPILFIPIMDYLLGRDAQLRIILDCQSRAPVQFQKPLSLSPGRKAQYASKMENYPAT